MNIVIVVGFISIASKAIVSCWQPQQQHQPWWHQQLFVDAFILSDARRGKSHALFLSSNNNGEQQQHYSRQGKSRALFLSSRDNKQQQQHYSRQGKTRALFLSNGDDEQQQKQQKPDLVDKNIFLAAIDRIRAEIRTQEVAAAAAAAAGSNGELLQQTTATVEEKVDISIEEEAKQDGYIYLVGKIDVELPIGTQPQLDLTESDGPLVLVTAVGDGTRDATGIQEFDTITKISVEDATHPLVLITKQTPLQATGGSLMEASQHALSLGKTTIRLEVQRLIKGYYAPPN